MLRIIQKSGLVLLPFVIILIVSRNILFQIVNPSWGDMVAIPPIQIPFSYLFYPWQDLYSGTFGGQYMPHFLFSQLVPFISPSLLQYIYLYFLFFVLYISFQDFFISIFKRKNFFDTQILLLSGILTLIIYFSNVFLVNLLQGNPDIYYPYILSIPAIFYLYLFIKEKDFLPILKMSILVTLATWFGSFAIYYMGIVMLPFFILFSVLSDRKQNVKFFSFLIIFALFLVANNLPYIYMTIKPIITAVGNVYGAESPGISQQEFIALYRGINHLNLFYFAGNLGDITWILFNIPGGFLYTSNNFYVFYLLQIVIVIGIVIFTKDKDSQRISKLLLGLLGIFLVFFTLIIVWDSSFFTSITNNLPLIALFRNPKKLILSLYVSYIVLLILLSTKIELRRYIKVMFFILLINFISVFPLINDGYNGLKNAYNVTLQTYKQDSQKAKEAFVHNVGYPIRFLELKSILNQLDKRDKNRHYRVVVFPDNSQSLYQSHLRYILNPFFVNPNQNIWGELQTSGSIMDYLYGSFLTNNIDNSMVMKIANIKYVVVDRKSPYYLYTKNSKPQVRNYYGIFTVGDPEKFNNLLKTNKSLQLVYSNSDFYVYKNRKFTDFSIYTPQQICTNQQFTNNNYRCDYFEGERASTRKVENNMGNYTITNINYKNPAKYLFTIEAKSSGTIPIFFSQSFDSFWSLKPYDNENIFVRDHKIGNFFGNTWVVDITKEGNYTFEINYTLQRSYAFAVIISIISTILNILLLIYLSIIHRRALYAR